MRPDHLKHGSRDDEAVKAIERRFEVDPGTQGPHTHKHLEDEKTQEDILDNIWKEKDWIMTLQCASQIKEFVMKICIAMLFSNKNSAIFKENSIILYKF